MTLAEVVREVKAMHWADATLTTAVLAGAAFLVLNAVINLVRYIIQQAG